METDDLEPALTDTQDPLLKMHDAPFSASAIADYGTARQERLVEFQTAISKSPEPLGAIMGANTAGLLEIGRRIEEAVLDRIPQQSSDLAAVEATLPAVHTLLRISKQAERYAVLQLRLAKANNM